MNWFEIAITVFLGITVVLLDVALMYGFLVFWHERHRLGSILFCMVAVAVTAFYMVTVINRVFA